MKTSNITLIACVRLNFMKIVPILHAIEKAQKDLLGLTDNEINHNRYLLQNDINQAKLVKNLKTFYN